MGKGVKSIDRQTGLVFDKRQTNIAKGVALLLLLWHHLFSSGNIDSFLSLYKIDNTPIECVVSDFCKVCVAIFLFLSGFGLTKSFNKYFKLNSINGKLSLKKNFRYVFNHIIKLLSDYWLVFIIFVPLGLLFGRSFITCYEANPICYLADFFGISYLFFDFSHTMNSTWWFMGVIILLYCLYPLLRKLLEYSGELLLVVSLLIMVFPLFSKIPFVGSIIANCSAWLFPFSIGMYFSYRDGFAKIQKTNNTMVKSIVLSISMMALFAIIRYNDNQSVRFDALFAISIILFSFFALSRIPILNVILEHLGQKSGLIFLFHTFIYSYFFHDFIYYLRYSPLVFLVMLIVCYLIAVGFEWIKKITRYSLLYEKIIKAK